MKKAAPYGTAGKEEMVESVHRERDCELENY